MKRKKDTGKPVKPVYDVPADWWYLLPDKVSLRQIYDLCRERVPWIWKSRPAILAMRKGMTS